MSCNASLTDKTPHIKIKKTSMINFQFILHRSSNSTVITNLSSGLGNWTSGSFVSGGNDGSGWTSATVACRVPPADPPLPSSTVPDLCSFGKSKRFTICPVSPCGIQNLFNCALGWSACQDLYRKRFVTREPVDSKLKLLLQKSREQKPTRGFIKIIHFFKWILCHLDKIWPGPTESISRPTVSVMFTFDYFVSFFL